MPMFLPKQKPDRERQLSFWYSDRRTIGSRAEKGSSSDFSPDS